MGPHEALLVVLGVALVIVTVAFLAEIIAEASEDNGGRDADQG
jgi:hypothetical protein